MDSLQHLQKRIEAIEERNKRVELDKAWESSLARKLLIVLFTYSILGSYMWIIGVGNPLLNAIIPTLGFILSTLSLSFFKQIWEKRAVNN